MMQILQAGGMTLMTTSGPPLYEIIPPADDNDRMTPDEFMIATNDKAMKLLGSHTVNAPLWTTLTGWKCIIMIRDFDNQTESFVKYNRDCHDRDIDFNALKTVLKEEQDLLIDGMKKLADQNGGDVKIVRFEQVLDDPLGVAFQLKSFLDLDLDTKAMAAAVKERSPKCYDGWLEKQIYEEQTGKPLEDIKDMNDGRRIKKQFGDQVGQAARLRELSTQRKD